MTNGNGHHLEQLAPNSVEAEQALIGSVLLNPAAYQDVAQLISPASFYIVGNAWVWEAVQRITARQENVDYLSVADELRQQDRLEELGGAAYLTGLINQTPSSIYAETYAGIVERAYIRRRYLQAASAIAKLAHDGNTDIHAVIEGSEQAVLNVAARRASGDVTDAPDIMGRVMAKVMKARETGVSGIKTGLAEIDHLTGGLQPTDFTVIAGRPGMGKTSMLLTIAFNICEEGRRPLIVSKEMTDEQLGERLASMDCGIATHKFRTGDLTDADFLAFTQSVDKISQWKFKVEDGRKKHIRDVAALARRQKRDFGIDVLMVDYLTLLSGDGDNRSQEVGSISRGLKAIARELKIPVLAAAQLSRKCEERQDKRPILSDLRDSGEIEQDADLVWFLYRDDVYNENTTRPNQTDVLIAKHRNGPTGSATLYFRKELTRFANLRKTDIDLAGYSREFDKATIPALPHAARTRPVDEEDV